MCSVACARVVFGFLDDFRCPWQTTPVGNLGSHAQVTDAHLLAIALHHGGKLATFAHELVNLAPAAEHAVVLVPA